MRRGLPAALATLLWSAVSRPVQAQGTNLVAFLTDSGNFAVGFDRSLSPTVEAHFMGYVGNRRIRGGYIHRAHVTDLNGFLATLPGFDPTGLDLPLAVPTALTMRRGAVAFVESADSIPSYAFFVSLADQEVTETGAGTWAVIGFVDGIDTPARTYDRLLDLGSTARLPVRAIVPALAVASAGHR
jgi:hypothetical protein